MPRSQLESVQHFRRRGGVGEKNDPQANHDLLPNTRSAEHQKIHQFDASSDFNLDMRPKRYDSGSDEVIRLQNSWMYRNSRLNQIPIPRAPIPTFGEVTPHPRVCKSSPVFYPVKPNIPILVHGLSDDVLQRAIRRYQSVIADCASISIHPGHLFDEDDELNLQAIRNLNLARKSASPWASETKSMRHYFLLAPPCPPSNGSQTAIQCVVVVVRRLGGAWPSINMKENYSLLVTPSSVNILADETWGALRGLETLSQLLWCSPTKDVAFINETFIEDSPSFPHRGLNLDTARHFFPKSILLLNLEAMEFNKLNVFHWHLSDDQSFPFESKTMPDLTRKAAFHPQMVYTHDDVREIVEFARVRGIRVVPEFDIPGHTRVWSQSHPQILVKCFESGTETPFYGGMDPINPKTLDYLTALFREILELFPDANLHMGFDEMEFGCWNSNPSIRQYMERNGITETRVLLQSFATKLLNRIQKVANQTQLNRHRRFIFWQEAHENNLKLPENSTIQLWKSVSNLGSYLNYNLIVSFGWYLDHINKPNDWMDFYQNQLFSDPYSNGDSPSNLIGGEACMWTEWQSDDTVLQRIWPITSAIAERLWFYRTPDIDEISPRLEEQRCRISRRGIPVGVLNGPGMCPLPLPPKTRPQGDWHRPLSLLPHWDDYHCDSPSRLTGLSLLGLAVVLGFVVFLCNTWRRNFNLKTRHLVVCTLGAISILFLMSYSMRSQ